MLQCIASPCHVIAHYCIALPRIASPCRVIAHYCIALSRHTIAHNATMHRRVAARVSRRRAAQLFWAVASGRRSVLASLRSMVFRIPQRCDGMMRSNATTHHDVAVHASPRRGARPRRAAVLGGGERAAVGAGGAAGARRGSQRAELGPGGPGPPRGERERGGETRRPRSTSR